MRWLATRTEERFGLAVALEVEGEPLVPHEAMRVLLFSLVRELLFNVAKHAQTPRASVMLTRTNEHLALMVEDEGVGFDPTTLETEGSGTGLGLRSMHERLELFNGYIKVESRDGRGTKVTLTVPASSLLR